MKLYAHMSMPVEATPDDMRKLQVTCHRWHFAVEPLRNMLPADGGNLPALQFRTASIRCKMG